MTRNLVAALIIAGLLALPARAVLVQTDPGYSAALANDTHLQVYFSQHLYDQEDLSNFYVRTPGEEFKLFLRDHGGFAVPRDNPIVELMYTIWYPLSDGSLAPLDQEQGLPIYPPDDPGLRYSLHDFSEFMDTIDELVDFDGWELRIVNGVVEERFEFEQRGRPLIERWVPLSATPVPEPGGAALLAGVAAGLAARGGRRVARR